MADRFGELKDVEWESAFQELYLRHTPQMYAAAISIVFSRDLAEEVVQNVMVRLWETRGVKVQNDIAGYLYRATCNEAYNLLRSEKRLHNREQSALINESDDDKGLSDL